MKLYHGGIAIIEKPDLSLGREKVDFGKGFYTTTLREQAEKWAIDQSGRPLNIKNNEKPFVSVFEFEENDWLFEKHFKGYTEDWLMFVVDNRRPDVPAFDHGYDLIEGNIADDKVFDTVQDFIELLRTNRVTPATVESTLQQLSYQEENDQICMKSEKAIKFLTFLEGYEVIDE
jgi:hypothetical protein